MDTHSHTHTHTHSTHMHTHTKTHKHCFEVMMTTTSYSSSSPHFCAVVGDLSCVPVLLHILQHYDVSSRHLASDLLLLLSLTPGGRSQVKNSDSLPLCLR